MRTMIEDLQRMQEIPGNCYNFHPGSHVSQGAEKGIELTADFLDHVLPHAGNTCVLIETMAGKGSEIGRTFREVADIMAAVKVDKSMLGVCLDTCHIWDGGYDIVNKLDDVIAEFDSIVGLQHLHAIHLNDSMNPLGAHKDRHQKIGQGCIGFEALLRVVQHPKLCNLTIILETPNEIEGYRDEIAMFRR
jgi:deoxyribonuclease-4